MMDAPPAPPEMPPMSDEFSVDSLLADAADSEPTEGVQEPEGDSSHEAEANDVVELEAAEEEIFAQVDESDEPAAEDVPVAVEATPEVVDEDPLLSMLSLPPAPPAPPEMPPMPPGLPPMPPMPGAPPAVDPLFTALSPPPAPAAPPMADVLATDPLMALQPVGEGVDLLATVAEVPAANIVSPDLTGEQAGATIRSLAEVETVIGDKLEGTLHEVETTTLSADGVIIKQSVKGTLTVNNPSDDDRIYDIDVLLDNIDATDLAGEHVSVDELEPSKNHTMAYKVNGRQMMTLRERFDTNPARAQERSLSVAISEDPEPIGMELEVENLSTVELFDVVVTRPIPECMHFVMSGGALLDDNTITWNVGRLHAGEKRTLSLEGTIKVSSTSSINAGKATATYWADATLSGMTFRELDAFCRGFTYMRVREDERPDNWRCQAIFENRSSFAVDLTKLQVRMKGSEDLLFDIHDVDQDVTPNGRWESEERTVMARSEPDFTYDLSYTVLPRAVQTSEGTMTLEEKRLDVLEASVGKKYSTGSLRSYRSQKVQATMTVKNEGSAPINLMRITDDIPGLFSAPSADQLSIKLDGKVIDDDQFKVELSQGVSIEKEFRSPDGHGHTMTLTIGTRGPLGLKPGKQIEITYPLAAPDPSPQNERVDAPARVEFSAERFGPICTREPLKAPSVKVIHNRRNFSAGKQAIPLGGKGRYEVLILFENNGDTALKDLYINDVLPHQFEIKEWVVKGAGGKRSDVKMNSEEGEGGLHITWHVPLVEKGERLEVSFDIKGTGEVDAEALNRFHGVHFGDEIETEALPERESSRKGTSDGASADEEATEEDAGDTEDSPGDSGIKFRDDMLDKVMESAGIDASHREEFILFAADYDHDQNGYLKKSELEDAANAWHARDGIEEVVDNTGEDSEEAAGSEESGESEPDSGATESSTEDKSCMICSTANAADALACSACGFEF